MKKNILKKFAAAALAAATVMSSMSVMAFAADAETGSVTITKYMGDTQDYETLETHYGAEQTSVQGEKLQNVKFAYIEVGDRVQVEVEENGTRTTEMLYTLSADAATALGINDADVTDGTTKYYRMSTLNTAIGNHKNEVIKLVKDSTNKVENRTDGTEGKAVFTNLSLEKLYLFAEIDATAAKKLDNTPVAVTKVSVPFFVSLPFTDASGNSVNDIYAYPKNSTGTAKIDKKIVEGETETETTTANIGDTINYKVTYEIPVGENGLEFLVVTDTMSKGLTFNNADNIKVLNGNTAVDKTMYTVNASKDTSTKVTTITITFDSDNYCKKLAPNTTQKFTITYTATLNQDAVLGQSGNTNDVFVTYTNTGDVDRKTEHKEDTKVFTYGIDLLKQGEGNTPLKNVEFELKDVTNNTVLNVKNNNDATNSYYTPNGNSPIQLTTNEQGKIYIKGLKPGTYQLTETKTNAGYVLLKKPVEIKINQTNAATGEAEAFVGGKKVTMIEDSGSDTAKVPLTVVNSKGFNLPVTGGRGIALFTIAGIAIVAAAGSLLFMRKRSK